MNNIKMTVVIGIVLSTILSIQASWTIQYDATILPGDSGSIVYSNGATSAFGRYPGTYTDEEIIPLDIFHLNTININGGGHYWKYVGRTDLFHANGTEGYSVEMRAKLYSTDESGFTSAALLDCDDGRISVTSYWSLALSTEPDGTNYARLSGEYNTPRTTPIAIGTDFHTYRVTVLQDSVSSNYMATLYMDKNEIGTVLTEDSVKNFRLRFGDLTSSADSDWEIDYIYGQDGPVPPVGTVLIVK